MSESEDLEQWEIDDKNREAGIVICDENCDAKEEPETLEEALASVEHWKNHGRLCGCSHGR